MEDILKLEDYLLLTYVGNRNGSPKYQTMFAVLKKDLHKITVSRDDDFIFYFKEKDNVSFGAFDAIEVQYVLDGNEIIGLEPVKK